MRSPPLPEPWGGQAGLGQPVVTLTERATAVGHGVAITVRKHRVVGPRHRGTTAANLMMEVSTSNSEQGCDVAWEGRAGQKHSNDSYWLAVWAE